MPSSRAEAWAEHFARAAISEQDRNAVAASESARSLILERLDTKDHDGLHGWAILGRVLADAGASPSLVAQAVDSLAAVAGAEAARDYAWASCRAALFESFVASQRDIADARVASSWRFPKCVVRLDDRTAAVAASFPDDDADAVARWADEVAAGLAKMGVRTIRVDGTASVRTALADALSAFGIDIGKTRA